jgi:hypothetical protein
MPDCGLWNTLFRHCCSLKKITLTPGHYIDEFLGKCSLPYVQVANAHIHAENANPLLVVPVRIEDDMCDDIYLHRYLAVVDKPTHRKFEVSKSVKIVCTGRLNMVELDVLC